MIPLRKNKRGTLPKTLKLTAKAPENGWLGDEISFLWGPLWPIFRGYKMLSLEPKFLESLDQQQIVDSKNINLGFGRLSYG